MRDLASPEQPSVIAAAWQHRWLVTSIVLAVTVAAAILAVSRPSQFEASASIVFEDPANLLGTANSGQAGRAVANELEILKSGAVLERAIETLAEQGMAGPDLFELRRDITISGLTNADVITIAYTADTAELAKATTSAVITAYQDIRGTQRDTESDLSLERLDSAEEVLLDDLEAVRTELAEVRAARGFAAMVDIVLIELSQTEAELLTQTSLEQRAQLFERQVQLLSQLEALERALETESNLTAIEALFRRENQILDRLADIDERRSEIAIRQSTQSSGVAFISPPTVSTGGLGLTRVLTALAGTVLGLLIALAIAYALINNRRTFGERVAPAQVLGTPLLADVPKFDPLSAKTLLPVRDNPRSAVAEAFRFAAATLELRMDRMGAKTVIGVSGLVSEGKTTVLANVALAAAKSGKRVLVVDADFGNQAISRLLLGDFRLGPGLTELVAGKVLLAEAAVPVSIGPGILLDVVGRGLEPVSAPSVFSSPDTRAIIDRMSDRYDLVFIDGPPLTQVAYGSALARLSDAALVVLAHGSSIHKAQDLRRHIEMVEVPLAGYVYNKAPFRAEMLASGGSMKDVIGDAGTTEPLSSGP